MNGKTNVGSFLARIRSQKKERASKGVCSYAITRFDVR